MAGAAEALRRAGVEAPRREALALLAAARGGSAADAALAAADDAELAPDAAARLEAFVARRAAGEPAAYVTGRAGFRHLELRCDRRALIPRPETEQLVELALARAVSGTAADIGTGTGCIALSLRHEGAFGRVLAVDLSADALALAAENARATGLAIDLVRADLTAALGDATLDLLVSNPPYLTESEWAGLDPAVRAWEPRLALPSGADGLAAIGRLARDGGRVVRAGGWLALEVDSQRAHAAAALVAGAGWRDVAVMRDLFDRERFVLARRSDER